MIGNCGSNTKIAVLDFVFGSLNHFREHMYFNCASFWIKIESCLFAIMALLCKKNTNLFTKNDRNKSTDKKKSLFFAVFLAFMTVSD